MHRFTISLSTIVACLTAAIYSAEARYDDGPNVNRNIIMVRFQEQSLARYAGGVKGLKAASPITTGARKLNVRSSESTAYLGWLRSNQDRHLAKISTEIGREAEAIFRYDVIINGFAIKAQPGDLEKIRSLPEVAEAAYDVSYVPDTNRSPIWIGADTVWDGTETGGLGSTRGEGIIVGVLDTGINFGHPSFSDSPDDAYAYINPLGPGNYLGWCDPLHPDYNPSYACNDKLIGAWDFVDQLSSESDGPEDGQGHGSHTASISSGNILTDPGISGVAPHTTVIAYDVCAPKPVSCPRSATSAAVQQAIIDGVDVINYSISGGHSPWSAFDINFHFLDALASGVFVAASAGNDGPQAGSVNHSGPWVLAVAASTDDQVENANHLTSMTSTGATAPSDIHGKSFTLGYGPASIVHASDFGNALCGTGVAEMGPTCAGNNGTTNPFAPGTFNGQIVVCDEGQYGRIEKSKNLQLAGAGGMVLANTDVSGEGVVAAYYCIPGINIGDLDGDVLRAWVATGSDHIAEITDSGVVLNPAAGDILASFSSRGPAQIDVIKPDMTAPGVSILAAFTNGADFAILNGTSMASPHAAGSAALLMALHPTWTPPEVRSALMSTADTTILKEDRLTSADPFDVGAGRIELGPASQAGLIMHETTANFSASNPASGGDPSTLNLVGMMNTECYPDCMFTRSLKNARSFSTDWFFTQTGGGETLNISASPSSFTLAAGATQSIDFTVTFSRKTGGQIAFGEGRFSEEGAQAPDTHFPFAVARDELLAQPLRIRSYARSGSVGLTVLRSTGATDLQLAFAGVVPVNRTRGQIEQDPSPSNPFDSDSGTMTVWHNGLTGVRRLHASTLPSSALDLDLFVGRDVNSNGIPEANEVRCASISLSDRELCEISEPTDGDWWIRVQNWQGSGAPLDNFTLKHGVVHAADAGNFSATGPMAVEIGAMFDITVNWNFGPHGGDGEYIGVLDFGSEPGELNDLGTINVDFSNDRVFANGWE